MTVFELCQHFIILNHLFSTIFSSFAFDLQQLIVGPSPSMGYAAILVFCLTVGKICISLISEIAVLYNFRSDVGGFPHHRNQKQVPVGVLDMAVYTNLHNSIYYF